MAIFSKIQYSRSFMHSKSRNLYGGHNVLFLVCWLATKIRFDPYLIEKKNRYHNLNYKDLIGYLGCNN